MVAQHCDIQSKAEQHLQPEDGAERERADLAETSFLSERDLEEDLKKTLTDHPA